MKPIILIPARMAATRLPGKPLRPIRGVPMIVHVVRRAEEAALGPVLVAAGDEEIVAAVKQAGGDAVLTDPNLPSGTDRIHAALMARDPKGEFDACINLQGDEPAVDPETIRKVYRALAETGADIATAVAAFPQPEDILNPNKVKALVDWKDDSKKAGMARKFARQVQGAEATEAWQHIGIYAYRRKALEQFVRLPQSDNEKRERLEQLRAMDAGMKIAAARVEKPGRGVDTEEDLQALEADGLN
jgi:3-deoxy-manno-octulosonate cytidylyltransferase (CMP-KDO synthetase)